MSEDLTLEPVLEEPPFEEINDTAKEPVPEITFPYRCSICVETYTDPRILSCLHTFCFKCINSIFDNDRNTVICPVCKNDSHLPCGDVASLHRNIRLNDEALRNNILQKIMSPSPVDCESCKGKAMSYCTTENCDGFMCSECYNNHERQTKKKFSHEILILEKTRKKSHKELADKLEKLYPSLSKCNEHSTNALDFHCNQCFKPVCTECMPLHHREHDTCKTDSDMMDTIKEEIRTEVTLFPTMLDEVKKVVQEIESTKQSLEQCEKDVCLEICNCFDELEQLLHQRKEVLVSKAKSIVEGKIAQLDEQLNILMKALHDMSHCQSVATVACNDYENVQLLSITKPIKERVTHLQEELKTVPLELLETSDMLVEGLNNKHEIKSMIDNYGEVVDSSPCANEVVTIIPRNQVARNVVMKVKVISMDCRRQRLFKGGSSVKAKLICDKETIMCDISDCDDGTYTIKVKSPNDGKHKLLVTINGRKIKNSPFQIRVVPIHDHASFCIPLKTITQVIKPKAIAFSNTDRMFISSESEKKPVQVYTSSGDEEITVIGLQQLSMPYGIDVCNDVVHIVDCKSNMMYQFSSTGEYLDSFCKKGTNIKQLLEPSDVKVSPDGEIYVSDTGNDRVQVFQVCDKDIVSTTVIGEFSCDEFVPNKMCFDLYGNVHIAGGLSKRVNVFSPKKEFVREYNCQVVATDIAIDAAGFSHVVGDTSLVIISPTGDLVHRVDGFGLLTGIGISPRGSVWVVDNHRNNNKIVKLAMDFFIMDD